MTERKRGRSKLVWDKTKKAIVKSVAPVELEPTDISYDRGGDIWIVCLRGVGVNVNLLLTTDRVRELHTTFEEIIHNIDMESGPK
jgi:hypothetical protein